MNAAQDNRIPSLFGIQYYYGMRVLFAVNFLSRISYCENFEFFLGMLNSCCIFSLKQARMVSKAGINVGSVGKAANL